MFCKTSVLCYHNAQSLMPENSVPQNHCHEDLNSHTVGFTILRQLTEDPRNIQPVTDTPFKALFIRTVWALFLSFCCFL